MYGTSRLWRSWIDRRRARTENQVDLPMRLSDLRRAHGLTQAELGKLLEMSQSDLSKLERRRDVKLSTLRSVAEALRYRLHVSFTDNARTVTIVTDSQAEKASLSGAHERAWVDALADDWDVASGDGFPMVEACRPRQRTEVSLGRIAAVRSCGPCARHSPASVSGGKSRGRRNMQDPRGVGVSPASDSRGRSRAGKSPTD